MPDAEFKQFRLSIVCRRTMLKPNDFVFLKMPEYGCIGEIMSYPIQEQTIMVRRVPGHPGTMEEVSLNQVTLYRGPEIKYVHYAKIWGRCSFPVDMLRHDVAAPVNFTINERGKAEIDPGFDDLMIGKVSEHKHPYWTEVRWFSFLWAIEHIKTEAIV